MVCLSIETWKLHGSRNGQVKEPPEGQSNGEEKIERVGSLQILTGVQLQHKADASSASRLQKFKACEGLGLGC